MGDAEPAYHDTYHIVAHWHFALQVLGALAFVWLLWWWMLPRFSRIGIWWGRFALTANVIGSGMMLLPMIDISSTRPLDVLISRVHVINTISTIGGVLVELSVLASVGALAVLGIRRLRQR